jgi:hypothetical protein
LIFNNECELVEYSGDNDVNGNDGVVDNDGRGKFAVVNANGGIICDNDDETDGAKVARRCRMEEVGVVGEFGSRSRMDVIEDGGDKKDAVDTVRIRVLKCGRCAIGRGNRSIKC